MGLCNPSSIYGSSDYPIRQSKPLRKHAYSNILKILPPNNENFQTKKSDIFHISAQNIDCGYSLEPPCRLERQKISHP